MTTPINVLLLEDDPADARLVELMLRRLVGSPFKVEIIGRMSAALDRLAKGDVQVVLADLSLPDSSGLATLTTLTQAAPDLPVVVLTGNDDDSQAIDALKHGAQDYLVKGRGDAFMLSRVIRYAIERKVGERAMTDARDKAEAAARAKSVFLAMMGHEVRTPLNGILGMARLLLDSPLDAKQRTFAETVVSSGELLLGLVNDILDFSRLEADKLTLEEVSFDFGEMVDELRLMMAPRAAEKGLTLGCSFGVDVPPFLQADALRLRQVLLNLVGNAIKFTEKGGVTIGVALTETPTARNDDRVMLRVTVSDTGIGIPESARDSMFTEFSQADNSITRRFGGTGLGLAICKRLVTLMGGEIGYDSEDGAGSRFWFQVPVLPTDAPPEMDQPAHGDTQPLRILLVDDNPVNREVAAGLLGRQGHLVTTMDDGESAVEAVSAATFDLVLLDMNMPGMDGIQTARAIRALPDGLGTQVPLWLVTANPQAIDAKLWREAGISGCLGKPFRVEGLSRLLAQGPAPEGGGVPEPDVPLLLLPDLLADMKDLGRDRMRGLVELFRTSSSADLALAGQHAANGDLAQLALVVHRMASAASSLHLSALHRHCRRIEDLGRAESPDTLPQAAKLADLWERSLKTLTESVQ